MRITNETEWSTLDLRRLIVAACRADGVDARRMTVVISTARGSGCSGLAWLNSHRMVLRLPAPAPGQLLLDSATRSNLARVAMHELAHCRGITHAEMDPELRRCGDGVQVAWADGIKIAARERPKSAPRNVVAERAEHAAKMLARAERRLKLARTIEKRWRAKVRYYERRAAAGGLVSKPRAPRPPRPKSWIPTVLEVRRALRDSNVREIEVGTRVGPDGKSTYDSRLWLPDVDLEDIHPLSSLLSSLRRDLPPEGVVADLYVQGASGLIGNADLSITPDGWSVTWS